MKKALKDLPLQEITLRKYEEPQTNDIRELSKKFLLSVGLLQPGESRDVIVDIFVSLLNARREKKLLTPQAILLQNPGRAGLSEPNVRRQLRRLKELKLVEKMTDGESEGYRITEFGSLSPVIDSFIIQYLINPSVERIKQYAGMLDKV
jgi:DNA-binding transcriptional ArsR family regulator